MRTSTLFGVSLASFLLPLVVVGEPHGHQDAKRHHSSIAKRVAGDVQLHKRFSNSRWTYYDAGLGACGKVNSASDFIVALNAAQFGNGYPGPNCFKMITMTYNGKTAQAQITDECPGCPYGGLDLTKGLFAHFSDLSAGVIYGEWHFNDGSGGGSIPPPPKPKPKPKPTTTKKEDDDKPTSTHTTSTKDDDDKKTTTSTKPTSTSVDYDSIKADGVAVPTGTVQKGSATDPENVSGMNNLVINLSEMINAGAQL